MQAVVADRIARRAGPRDVDRTCHKRLHGRCYPTDRKGAADQDCGPYDQRPDKLAELLQRVAEMGARGFSALPIIAVTPDPFDG